jgi:hypothetical protein
MKKKYIIADTGEEVTIGSKIKKDSIMKNSFGILRITETIILDSFNIVDFLKKGIIKCIDVETEDNVKMDEKASRNPFTLEYYIQKIADNYKCTVDEAIKWLNNTNKFCPKAVLDIFLEVISKEYQRIDGISYHGKIGTYYSLKLKDGTVGKVINPSNRHIPLFKDIKDAEDVRNILKDQLELMYGKQN